MMDPTKSDLRAMRGGCDQGCGAEACLRYMTGEEEPTFRCFFCDFLTGGDKAAMLSHLDSCVGAAGSGYERSHYQQMMNLPALMSDGCGKISFSFFPSA